MQAEPLHEVLLEESLLKTGIGNEQILQGAVPTIDLSSDATHTAAAMWDAACSTGFFQVINHGIDQHVIDSCFEASKLFFEQPRNVKDATSPFARHLNSGFEHFTQVRPATGTPDQKESLQITAREGAMDGRWPPVSNFKASTMELLDASYMLSKKILALLEPFACPSLLKGTLESAHTLWADDSQSTLRLLHYPPTEPPGANDESLWRAAPHTDWDCITLLFQRPGEAGLECGPNPRAAERGPWLAVDPFDGGIVVNIGDMLARWSDDRVLSNLHRVRMPHTAEEAGRPRFSIAFFMQADKHCMLNCESYPSISAGDFILERIKSNYKPNSMNGQSNS